MRVAFLHDWLFGMRGGEKCLEELVSIFPDCEVFSAFGELDAVSESLRQKPIHFSSFNFLPGVKNFYRHLLPVFPLVALNLTQKLNRKHHEDPFDLVISISHSIVKNVKTPESVPSVCYCLTPMRYIYDQFEAYFGMSKLKPVLKLVASYLRKWDQAPVRNQHNFIAISEFIKERIAAHYLENSAVIYPPVQEISIKSNKFSRKEYFLVANALVPYKNTHIIIEAFNRLGLPLKVVGKGPELSRLRGLAAENIEFCGWVADSELPVLYQEARAMVFAACEDFGITPVEAQMCGTPVIAYGGGGALETVTASTGLFFDELNVECLIRAVENFEKISLNSEDCVENAFRFRSESFREQFITYVKETLPGI